MIRLTPLVPAPGLGAHLKLENLQVTGSFKVRGAWRKLSALSAADRARGVVAASAGNHGLGLAWAGARLGIAVTVVVSELAPAVKRDGIARLGAQVIVDGRNYDAAEAIARRRAETAGAVFVSPFDDEDVIEGNGGTLADELIEQAPDLSLVVVPVGGGGLIAGIARRLAPRGIAIVGVEPAQNCAMHASLAQGRAQTVYDGGPTLAEGCEGAVCERTFAIVREHVDHIALVSEDAIRAAIAWCYRDAGQIIEPSAAVAVAALRERAVAPAPRGTTAAILTGGNIDPALFDECLGIAKQRQSQ
jgi:threonine dehydratase